MTHIDYPPIDDQDYVYDAEIDHIVDGDTFDVTIDLGFGILNTMRVRLMDINTAEIYGTDKESDEYHEGMRHKNYVKAFVQRGRERYTGTGYPFVLYSDEYERGKYGRTIGAIYAKGLDEWLGAQLVQNFGTELISDE